MATLTVPAEQVIVGDQIVAGIAGVGTTTVTARRLITRAGDLFAWFDTTTQGRLMVDADTLLRIERPAEPGGDEPTYDVALDVEVSRVLDNDDSRTSAGMRAAAVEVAVPSGGALVAAPAFEFLRELRRDTRDLVWLHIGDSTSRGTKPWPRTVLDRLGQAYPSRTTEYIAPLDADPLAYQPAQVRQTGTGARKVTLYNASRSGKSSRYVQGANWATVIDPVTPDLITVSHGHNDAVMRAMFRSDYAALVESLRAQFPYAEVLLIGQNPQTNNTNQDARVQEVARLARARGYGFANVHDAYALRPGGFANLMLDTTHPTEAGHDLYADEVMKHLTWNPHATPLLSGPSSLITSTENLAPEGALKGWDGTSAIPGFTITGPATLSKNTTNYETKGYAVKVTATGASAILNYTLPADRLPLVRGRNITLAARLLVPSGQPAGVGRIGFTDGTQLVSNPNAEGQGAFRWAVFTGPVAPAASTVRLMLYAADTSATAGGEITVDRIICCRGTLPRDYFTA